MRIHLLLLGICFLLFSCTRAELMVNKTDTALQMENGVLHYQNIPFTGLLIATYADNSFSLKMQYKKGRKDGYEKQWYANGTLSQSRLYAKGIKIDNHLGWWENGLPKFNYYFNEKGAYEGSRKEWYKNGQALLSFNYMKGKEHGSQRMWNDAGKIKANYDVVNGERFGLIGLKKCYTVNKDSNALQ